MEYDKNRLYLYKEGVVTDDTGAELSPLDDDYYSHKTELEDLTNPLSDDYCKYDNE